MRLFFSLLLFFSFLSPAYGEERADICTVQPAVLSSRLTGFTRARSSMSVVSEVSGRCLEVTADVGQTPGDDGVFARIDPIFIELEERANRLDQEQARRQLEYDQLQVDRYEQLFSSRTASQSRLDELVLRRDMARLALRQLEVSGQRIDETRKRHVVPVPPGWLISKRQLEPGQWITAGQVLAEAGDYSRLIVPLALTGEELQVFQKEEEFPLSFPDLARSGTATILRYQPGFDPETRKTQVDLLVDAASIRELPWPKSGLRVEISLPLADPMRGFLIPAASIQERYGDHWLTRENGQQLRVIVLGAATPPQGRDGSWMRVASPELAAGERFLCDPPSSR